MRNRPTITYLEIKNNDAKTPTTQRRIQVLVAPYRRQVSGQGDWTRRLTAGVFICASLG